MDKVMEALQGVLEKKEEPAELRWYEFDQNNSGGSFRLPAHVVWIQAGSSEEAARLAEAEGLYFDGCESGLDCPCCGDRWYQPWHNEGEASPFPTGEKGGIQHNVLCDELPESGKKYTRFITNPTSTPWGRDDMSDWGRSKKVMLRAHNGTKAYCEVARYYDHIDWSY